MPKRFTGDETHRLVTPTREAYRLWFSFLRMALEDPDLQPEFDAKFYAPWGNIKSVKNFDDWWATHWRLFAFESDTKVVRDASAWRKESRDSSKIVISIPRDQTLAETKRQLEMLLKAERSHSASRNRQKAVAAQFAISTPNLKYASLRLLERIYGLWLKNNRNTEATAKAYFAWAKARNEQIRKHNTKVSDTRAQRRVLKLGAESERAIGLQPSVKKMRWERAIYKMQVTETGWGSKSDERYDQRRYVIWRYIRKARQIAKNTARGKFPGDYTV
jgi:hypothetical protein